MRSSKQKEAFSTDTSFQKGDVVLHKRFGPGFVVDTDEKYIRVQFYSKPGPITYRAATCGLLKAFL